VTSTLRVWVSNVAFYVNRCFTCLPTFL